MNLEEELATLESQSTITQPINNVNEQMTNVITDNTNTIMSNMQGMENQLNNQLNNQVIMTTTTQYQPQNQPAMVNPNTAAQQTAGFNYASLEFDINKPLFEKNPLERLTGDKGDIFRVHLLPNVSPSQVHVHFDASSDKGHNFVCLKDVYGTLSEPCCISHNTAKTRIVLPIIVYPTVKGNPNALVPGQKAELRTLVLGYKSFQELQNQANLAGVVLTQGDIFATVDNPTYKSFNFTVRQDSLISQVPNSQELIDLWKAVGTPENICKAAGRVITRDEYQASYSNYNFKEHENQAPTPTQGQTPGSFTFTTPMYQPQGGFQPPYQPTVATGVPSQQPFYNGNQTATIGQFQGNNQNGTTNPWG